jgi:hypothetical protein
MNTATTSNKKRSYVYQDYRLDNKRIKINEELSVDEGCIDVDLNIAFEKLFQIVRNYNRKKEENCDEGFVDCDDIDCDDDYEMTT